MLREWRAEQPDVATLAPSGVSDPEGAVEAYDAILDDWVTYVDGELGIPAGQPESFDVAMEQHLGGSDIVDDRDAFLQQLDGYLASALRLTGRTNRTVRRASLTNLPPSAPADRPSGCITAVERPSAWLRDGNAAVGGQRTASDASLVLSLVATRAEQEQGSAG